MFGGSKGPLEVLKPNDRSGSNRVDPMSMGHAARPCRSRITAVDRLNQQRHQVEAHHHERQHHLGQNACHESEPGGDAHFHSAVMALADDELVNG